MRSDGAINFATDFGMTVELLLPTTAAYKQRLRDKKQQTSVSSSKQVHSRPIPSQLARARPTSPNRPTSPDLA